MHSKTRIAPLQHHNEKHFILKHKNSSFQRYVASSVLGAGMMQIAVSPFRIPSVFIVAVKTIQCISVLAIITSVANSQVVEGVTALKASR